MTLLFYGFYEVYLHFVHVYFISIEICFPHKHLMTL